VLGISYHTLANYLKASDTDGNTTAHSAASDDEESPTEVLEPIS